MIQLRGGLLVDKVAHLEIVKYRRFSLFGQLDIVPVPDQVLGDDSRSANTTTDQTSTGDKDSPI